MKTAVDACLTTEAERFGLRFACDDCVHFAPERLPTCGNGWPLRLRRGAIDPASADREEALPFCKEFELG